jgi:malonyl CoA-acyl carrier protein transacylase
MQCPDDKTQQVLLEVRYERDRQTEKYGEESHADGVGNHLNISGTATECMKQAQEACDDSADDGSMTFWHILFEEVLEANAAPDKNNLREELIQIAAAAVAWVEKLDRETGD